jgi:hypothetical protein
MISLKVQITCVVERIEQGLDHGLPCAARLAKHCHIPSMQAGIGEHTVGSNNAATPRKCETCMVMD